MGKKILENATADVGEPTDSNDSQYMEVVAQGIQTIHVYGKFSGATVKVYMYNGGIANVANKELLDGYTFTVDSINLQNISLAGGTSIHAELENASDLTDLTCDVQGIGLR